MTLRLLNLSHEAQDAMDPGLAGCSPRTQEARQENSEFRTSPDYDMGPLRGGTQSLNTSALLLRMYGMHLQFTLKLWPSTSQNIL